MQAYTKSSIPYYGVPAPEQRQIYRAVFKEHPLSGWDRWHSTVLALWRQARFREERYAAIELSGHRLYRAFQTLETLPMYEEIITTGAWWDYVDAVAIHRVGAFLLRDFKRKISPLLRNWSRSDDLWKRRTSIISQVSSQEETNLGLLYHCIENNLDDREFFIRKAIGWALRAYAWTNPAEVRRYVAANESRLSPLSRREALKNVGQGRSA